MNPCLYTTKSPIATIIYQQNKPLLRNCLNDFYLNEIYLSNIPCFFNENRSSPEPFSVQTTNVCQSHAVFCRYKTWNVCKSDVSVDIQMMWADISFPNDSETRVSLLKQVFFVPKQVFLFSSRWHDCVLRRYPSSHEDITYRPAQYLTCKFTSASAEAHA